MTNIIALIIFILLSAIGIIFLNKGKLKAWSFITFILTLCIIFIGFYSIDRLKEINLKEMKLVLEKAEKMKDEIYAKEKQLKDTAVALVKLTTFTAAMNMRLGESEDYRLRQRYVKKVSEELLKTLEIEENEKQNAFELYLLLENYDDAKEKGNVEEKNEINKKIKEKMREYTNSINE